MGLQQVVEDVRQDGAARAAQVVQEAEEEARRILQAADEQVAEYRSARQAQADRDVAQEEAQSVSHAEFESRKVLLTTEAELRESFRAKLVETLAGLDARKRNAHVKKLLQGAAETVAKGTVYGAKKDEKALKASDYKFGGTVDIAGGIIVESADGTVRLDLSYETLLDGMWRDILASESKLFR